MMMMVAMAMIISFRTATMVMIQFFFDFRICSVIVCLLRRCMYQRIRSETISIKYVRIGMEIGPSLGPVLIEFYSVSHLRLGWDLWKSVIGLTGVLNDL